MGPIERELRRWPVPVRDNGDVFCFTLSSEAWGVFLRAWCSLGPRFGHPQSDEAFPDIMSESIEAAEALGL